MSPQLGRGPIIEHEGLIPPVTARGPVWRAMPQSAELPRARIQRSLWPTALWATLAGMGVLAAGAAVLLLSTADVSWAQGTSWRAIRAGDAAGLRDAVVAGSESGLPLYPCRAAYAGSTLLGRYRADFAGCHIGYDSREVEAAPFEILGPSWTEISEGARALVVGEVADAGDARPLSLRPVAVCRASYQGATHPGSWIAPDKGCSFGFGGRVVTSQNFTVLQAAPWMTWVPAMAATAGTAVTPLMEGAVKGGEEGGEPFYLCRAPTPRGVLAGKIKSTSPGCSVPLDGKELVESRFELLMPRWASGAAGVGAVAAGREKAELQFPCRAKKANTLQPGRATDTRPGCRVGMQSTEVVLPDYDVLAQ